MKLCDIKTYHRMEESGSSDQESNTLSCSDGSVKIDPDIELPEVVRRMSLKKEKFKGFYMSQKTLLDSRNTSLDHGPSIEDSGIPKIVEDLVKPTTESDDDESTEHSEISMTDQDKKPIATNHKTKGFQGPMKNSASLQSIKQQRKDMLCAEKTNNAITSEEDLSDRDDSTLPERPKRKLKIVFNDSDDESADKTSDEAKKAVKKKKENKGKKKNQEKKTVIFSDGDDTDASDVIVTDKDYYTIRHDSEYKTKKEFILCFSPKKVSTKMQSSEEIEPKVQKVPTSVFPSPEEDGTGNETSDEEVGCEEEDFMTMEEFLEAHKTDYEFHKEPAKKSKMQRTESIVCQNFKEVDDENEDSNTESLKESFVMDLSHDEDFDGIAGDTDNEEMELSVHDTSTPEKKAVHFSSHSVNDASLEGVAKHKEKKNSNQAKLSPEKFKPEIIALESDDDGNVISEELDDLQEKTQMMVLEKDDTDDENLSDFADDTAFMTKEKEYDLPKLTKKLLKVTTSIDGDVRVVENNCEQKHRKKKVIQENEISDEEVIESFTSPNPDAGLSFPEFNLVQLEQSVSRTKSQQKQKTSNKRRNSKYRTVQTEEL